MKIAPLLGKLNKNFLELYNPYLVKGWAAHYFYYDLMKDKYKSLKEEKVPNLEKFEHDFYDEIYRVDHFLMESINEIENDLQHIIDKKDFFAHAEENSNSKTCELFIRKVFDKCKSCAEFHRLNQFVICKIAKKFEKLIEKENKSKVANFKPWSEYPSCALFNHRYAGRITHIELLTNKCTEAYSDTFRKTYKSLAFGELTYVKNKERENSGTRVFIGFKLGIIFCIIAWLITESYVSNDKLDFWNQPGLYVYTTVANFLIVRIAWLASIYIWPKFYINYISILQLSDINSNIVYVFNQLTTLCIFYFLNLLIFFYTNNNEQGQQGNHFLSYGSPALLVLWTIIYEIYVNQTRKSDGLVVGLFSRKVLYNCFIAPFAAVSFRDVYAADVMTSFTKVTADFLYASCWIVSGSFLIPHRNEEGEVVSDIHNFGSDYMSCTGTNALIVIAAFQIFPLWIRLAQCLRVFSTTKLIFPHIFNTIKYALSILVVLYGFFRHDDFYGYIVIVGVTALYKWWWDIVMDWGLFDIFPESDSLCPCNEKSGYLLLREQLMFPHPIIYYICIVLDLILRFLWVVSLDTSMLDQSFIGPKLSFFLAAMEIIRRMMWGFFRVEYEHLKLLKKQTVGFVETKGLHMRRRSIATNHSITLPEELLRKYKGMSNVTSDPLLSSTGITISNSHDNVNIIEYTNSNHHSISDNNNVTDDFVITEENEDEDDDSKEVGNVGSTLQPGTNINSTSLDDNYYRSKKKNSSDDLLDIESNGRIRKKPGSNNNNDDVNIVRVNSANTNKSVQKQHLQHDDSSSSSSSSDESINKKKNSKSSPPSNHFPLSLFHSSNSTSKKSNKIEVDTTATGMIYDCDVETNVGKIENKKATPVKSRNIGNNHNSSKKYEKVSLIIEDLDQNYHTINNNNNYRDNEEEDP